MAKKKNRIPKKLFGVKIPKVMRRNSLVKSLLNNPAGRQIIANALVAAAGAAATALVATTEGPAKAGAAVADAGEDASKIAKRAFKSAAGALTEALSSAAKSALGEDERARLKQQRAAARTH
jgi:hypothetical protein